MHVLQREDLRKKSMLTRNIGRRVARPNAFRHMVVAFGLARILTRPRVRSDNVAIADRRTSLLFNVRNGSHRMRLVQHHEEPYAGSHHSVCAGGTATKKNAQTSVADATTSKEQRLTGNLPPATPLSAKSNRLYVPFSDTQLLHNA